MSENLDLGVAILELRAVNDKLMADLARLPGEIEAAVRRIEALAVVTFTGNASPLLGAAEEAAAQVSEALAEAAQPVELSVDASSLEGEAQSASEAVASALDAAAEPVEITGDATGLEATASEASADVVSEMAAAQAAASVEMTGDASGIVSAAEEASSAIESVEDAADGLDLAGFGDALKTGLAAVAGAAAVAGGALAALVVKTGDAADAAGETAQQFGTSTAFIGGFRLALSDAGVEAGQADMALRQLTGKLTDFVAGGEQSKATFDALGISIADVTNGDGSLKSLEEIVPLVADRFSKMRDGVEKTSIAGDVFGERVGSKLIPVLNGGAVALKEIEQKAIDSGYAFSAAGAAAGDEFGRATTELKANVVGLGQQIGTALLPEVTGIVGEVNRWFDANRELISQNVAASVDVISGALRTAVEVAGSTAEAFSIVVRELRTLIDTINELSGLNAVAAAERQAQGIRDAGGSTALALAEAQRNADSLRQSIERIQANGIAGSYEEDLAKLQARLVEAEAKVGAFKAALADEQRQAGATADAQAEAAEAAAKTGDAHALSVPKIRSASAAKDAARAAAEAERDALAALKDELSATAKSHDVVITSSKDLGTALAASTAKYEETIAAAEAAGVSEDALANIRREASAQLTEDYNTATKLATERQKEMTESAAELAQTINGLGVELADIEIARAIESGDPAGAVQALESKFALLNAQIDDTQPAVAAMKRALLLEQQRREVEELARTFGDLGVAVSDTVKSIADGLGPVFADGLFNGFDSIGRDLGDLLQRELEKMVADLLTKNIFGPLASQLLGLFSGADFTGGILSGITGALSGAAPAAVAGAAPGVVEAAATVGAAAGGTMAAETAGGFAAGIPGGLAAVGPAAIAAGAVLAIDGATKILKGGSKTGEGLIELGLAIFPPAAIVGVFLEAFDFGEPSRAQVISRALRESLTKALGNADIVEAVEAGLGTIDVPVTEEIIKQITRAPRSGAFVREQFAQLGPEIQAGASEELKRFIAGSGNATNALTMDDFLLLLFPDMQGGEVRSELQAIGAQAAQMQGLTGRQAIDFADEFAKGLLVLGDQLGLTNDELLAFLGTTGSQMGAAVDQFRALEQAEQALAQAGNFDSFLPGFKDYVGTLTDADVSGAEHLVDVFKAAGLSADDFVKLLRRYADENPAFVGAVDAFEASMRDAADAAKGLTAETRKLLVAAGTAAASAAQIAGEASAAVISQAGEALAAVSEQGAAALDQLAAAEAAVRAAAEGATGEQRDALLALADSLGTAEDEIRATGDAGADAGDAIGDGMDRALTPTEQLVESMRELVELLREAAGLSLEITPPPSGGSASTGGGRGGDVVVTSGLDAPSLVLSGFRPPPPIDLSGLTPVPFRDLASSFRGADASTYAPPSAQAVIVPPGYQAALVPEGMIGREALAYLRRSEESGRVRFGEGRLWVHTSERGG